MDNSTNNQLLLIDKHISRHLGSLPVGQRGEGLGCLTQKNKDNYTQKGQLHSNFTTQTKSQQ